MYRETAKELLQFIEKSPSCFHVIDNIKQRLLEQGYEELREEEEWKLERRQGYFVTRNASSVIAFRIPEKGETGFQIIASHSDSPSFKIKENPDISVEKQYTKLNVEKYGGMIMNSWMDRPLSVAGRILVEEEGRIVEKLVDMKRDLLMIPNLAIHMNREVNQGVACNAQTDMLPVLGEFQEEKTFLDVIAQAAGVSKEQILGNDLFLYNRMPGTFWGREEEYIAAPRLDDLQCVFASLKGFLECTEEKNIPVYCVFDNEETGSQSKQGAASGFLRDTLERICKGIRGQEEEFLRMLAGSFMISADNAQGMHPAHGEKADPVNRPYLNRGIVLKYSANQKYTTDGVSAAVLRQLCRQAEIPVQVYTNRSDIPGGSTLGNISSTQVAVDTVDIGLAQWAMHSAYESAGGKDTHYLCCLAKKFYESRIYKRKQGIYVK